MSTILSTAVTGLYRTVAGATHSANNVVNASSTGKNIDGDMVNLVMAKTQFVANVQTIKTYDKMQKALLDILA